MKQIIPQDCIQLYNGNWFNYSDLTSNVIDIKDIAHALSLLCRFGGHTERFYSVAEHCFWCASVAPQSWKFEALMHDASEAYMVDIPRPLKQLLPEYKKMEKQLEEVIADQFELSFPMAEVISQIDNRMLLTEKKYLLKDRFDWHGFDGIELYDIEPIGFSPDRAERMFLNTFYSLI